ARVFDLPDAARGRRRHRAGDVLAQWRDAQGWRAAPARRSGLSAGDAVHPHQRCAAGGAADHRRPSGDSRVPRLSAGADCDGDLVDVAVGARSRRACALHRACLPGAGGGERAVGRRHPRARRRKERAAVDRVFAGRPAGGALDVAQAQDIDAAADVVAHRALHRNARERRRHAYRVPVDRPAAAAAAGGCRRAALPVVVRAAGHRRRGEAVARSAVSAAYGGSAGAAGHGL
ncbi:MAG: hypothetical protein AVDCRST_MAG71-2052, partial [uncultured Lysobacter sp.]